MDGERGGGTKALLIRKVGHVFIFNFKYLDGNSCVKQVFGSFALSTEEPYTIMLCPCVFVVLRCRRWHLHLCTPLLARELTCILHI